MPAFILVIRHIIHSSWKPA